MADDSMTATVLPKELRLGVPPKMPQGRSYLFRQQSTLASIVPTGTITINIPRLQRSYLRKDSYLRFRVSGSFSPAKDNSVLNLDNSGAYGFFERMEVFDYLGSTVLESISGIPQLTSLLMDMGMKEMPNSTYGNVTAGLGQDYTFCGTSNLSSAPTGLTTASNVDPLFQQSAYMMKACLGGHIVRSWENVGDGIAVPFTREFAIPLPSFLGMLSDKMVPLHNGFTIVLTVSSLKTPFVETMPLDARISIAPSITPVITDIYYVPAEAQQVNEPPTNVNWNITDVYMNCQILELGPVAESMILSSTQGNPLVVYTKSFRNYVGNIKGSTWPNTSSGSYALYSERPVEFPLQILLGKNDTFTVGGSSYTMTAGTVLDINSLRTKVDDVLPAAYTVTARDDQIFISSATTFTLTGNGCQSINVTVNRTSMQGFDSVTSTGQSEFILNMNLNVASLTNVLWMMRSSSQLDSILYPSVSNRTRNFLQRWQFQYGSTTLPQSNGIQSMASSLPQIFGGVTSGDATLTNGRKYNMYSKDAMEAYNELMKSRPVDKTNSRIDFQNYCWDYKFNDNLDKRNPVISGGIVPLTLQNIMITPKSPVTSGKFACGLNLQLANNKEGQIISGLNTNGMNTSIRAIFHPLYTDLMDSVRVDAWAEYDAFINISPGIATTVSF